MGENSDDELEPPEGSTRLGKSESDEPPEYVKVLAEHDGDLDWMTETDALILNALLSGLTLSPSIIADNIDRSRENVSRRLSTMQAGGLVKKVDRGKYEITKLGWASTHVKFAPADERVDWDDLEDEFKNE